MVTGGAGFVGSHIVDRLSPDNKVTILDSLFTGSLKNLGESFNIATGVATSVNKIIESIIQISGRENQIIYADSRAGEIRHSWATIEKVRKMLGYSAKTSLSEGLSLTWESVT